MGNEMRYVEVDPNVLKPNSFNTNIVSADNEEKLDASVERLGMFKPIVCRTLKDGTLEILGGEHRVDSAKRLGMKTVPIINLGEVDDKRAKEIGLVDNGRYGADDTLALADLLDELGNPEELAKFLPYSDAELTSIFSSVEIKLEDIDIEDDDDPKEKITKAEKTHQLMRFKVPLDDCEFVSDLIEATAKSQGFTYEDSLTNAGDALVHILKAYVKGLNDDQEEEFEI